MGKLINPSFKKRGYIQIYTGNGKGKTTAAMGLATRALGKNWKVFAMLFCKGGATNSYGELIHFTKNTDGIIKVYNCGLNSIPYSNTVSDEDRYEATKGWWKVIHNYREYDLIILDELCIAINLGLLHILPVIDFLDNKPKNLEVVITGRDAPPCLVQRADLVTEMRPIKHYFNKGVIARNGIQF